MSALDLPARSDPLVSSNFWTPDLGTQRVTMNTSQTREEHHEWYQSSVSVYYRSRLVHGFPHYCSGWIFVSLGACQVAIMAIDRLVGALLFPTERRICDWRFDGGMICDQRERPSCIQKGYSKNDID